MSLQVLLRRIRSLIGRTRDAKHLRQLTFDVLPLEDRCLPDASFALVGSVLELGAFDAGETVSAQDTGGGLEFTLSTGVWDSALDTAMDDFSITGGGKVLTYTPATAPTGVQIDGLATTAVVDGANGLTVGTLEVTSAITPTTLASMTCRLRL